MERRPATTPAPRPVDWRGAIVAADKVLNARTYADLVRCFRRASIYTQLRASFSVEGGSITERDVIVVGNDILQLSPPDIERRLDVLLTRWCAAHPNTCRKLRHYSNKHAELRLYEYDPAA